jgi:hypothetical protein
MKKFFYLLLIILPFSFVKAQYIISGANTLSIVSDKSYYVKNNEFLLSFGYKIVPVIAETVEDTIWWTQTEDTVATNVWPNIAWDEEFPANICFGSNDTLYKALFNGTAYFNPIITLTPVFWNTTVLGGLAWDEFTDYSINDRVGVGGNKYICAIACGPGSDWGAQNPENPIPFWEVYTGYQLYNSNRNYSINEKILNTEKSKVFISMYNTNLGHTPK